MDCRQSLINILKDLQNNLKIVLRLAQTPSDEPLEERFYCWIKESIPLDSAEDVPIMSNSYQSFKETADVVHRFVQVVVEQIASGQSVDGSQSRMTQLQEDKEKMENKLQQLKSNEEQEEALQKLGIQSRIELIQELKFRIKQTEERTAACLRLAK